MKSIETEVIINGTQEQVWEVLMSHEDYPKWNPFIKKIEGGVAKGSSLQVEIQSSPGKTMNFKPVVMINEKFKEFRWKGKFLVKGIFDGEHYFVVKKEGENKVKFIHGEKFTGLLSRWITKMIYDDTKKGFQSMNRALKTLVEN